MKRGRIGAIIAAVLLLAVPAGAQVGVYSFPDPTTLVGPGASIGVRVRDVSAQDLEPGRLETAGGVYIEEVGKDSPAERAGLKAGDIVTEFDGERVRSVRNFARLVSETPPQRTVKASVIRSGSRLSIDITPERARLAPDLSELRRNPPMLRALPPAPGRVPDIPGFETAPPPRRLGVTLGTLDGQLAEYFGVSNGVLVSAVDRESPAARAGVKAGDVITAVNGRTVTRPTDVSEVVRDTADGGTVELKVMRDRKEILLRVTLQGAAADAAGRIHL